MSLLKHSNIVRGKKVPAKKPKFKVGDMVYSWQNPTVKRRISHISLSDDPTYNHKYKVALYDKEGYSYSSKWIDEKSISKTKQK